MIYKMTDVVFVVVAADVVLVVGVVAVVVVVDEGLSLRGACKVFAYSCSCRGSLPKAIYNGKL